MFVKGVPCRRCRQSIGSCADPDKRHRVIVALGLTIFPPPWLVMDDGAAPGSGLYSLFCSVLNQRI